jgi:hypothetical protein
VQPGFSVFNIVGLSPKRAELPAAAVPSPCSRVSRGRTVTGGAMPVSLARWQCVILPKMEGKAKMKLLDMIHRTGTQMAERFANRLRSIDPPPYRRSSAG